MSYSSFDECALSVSIFMDITTATEQFVSLDTVNEAYDDIDCCTVDPALEGLSSYVSQSTKELNAQLNSLKHDLESAYEAKDKQKFLAAVNKSEQFLNSYEKKIEQAKDDTKGTKMLKFAGKALILAISIAFMLKQKKLFEILSSNVSKAILNVSGGKAVKLAKYAGKASKLGADLTVGGIGVQNIIKTVTGAFKYRMAAREHPNDPRYQNEDFRSAKNMITNYRQILQACRQAAQEM